MLGLRSLAAMALVFTVAVCGGSTDDDGSGGSGGSAGDGGTGTSSGSGGSTTSTSGTGGGSVSGRCESFCEDLVAANCSDGPTMDGCMLTCLALTSAATCDPTATDYFDCVDAAGIECNPAGDPIAQGCGDEWLLAIDCAVTENPNPAIEGPCDSYCDDIVAAGCPSNGTKEECYANCLWLGATGTGCDDEWSTFLTCADTATFSCLLGYAVAEGCGPDFQAYTDCIDAAGNP